MTDADADSAETANRLDQFVVQADRDGDLTLEHWLPEGLPWCHWDVRVENGTSLPQLAKLAADHLTEAHRTVITLDAEQYTTGSEPGLIVQPRQILVRPN